MIRAGAIASVSGMRSEKRLPLPCNRRQRHRAADGFDVRADDVHADAAAGNVGDDLCSREAGLEDVALDLFDAHGLQLLLGRETLRENLLS